MLRMQDVHCPDCGTFRILTSAKVKACPDCGNAQAFALSHDYEIDARFRAEREQQCN